MRLMLDRVRRHVRREEGQSLVEVSLILGLVSVVAIAGLTSVGDEMRATLQRAVDAIAAAM